MIGASGCRSLWWADPLCPGRPAIRCGTGSLSAGRTANRRWAIRSTAARARGPLQLCLVPPRRSGAGSAAPAYRRRRPSIFQRGSTGPAASRCARADAGRRLHAAGAVAASAPSGIGASSYRISAIKHSCGARVMTPLIESKVPMNGPSGFPTSVAGKSMIRLIDVKVAADQQQRRR
jgi:hypothetical protein